MNMNRSWEDLSSKGGAFARTAPRRTRRSNADLDMAVHSDEGPRYAACVCDRMGGRSTCSVAIIIDSAWC
jgi:hypothetical protein